VSLAALLGVACTGEDPPAPQRPGESGLGPDGATPATVPADGDAPGPQDVLVAGFDDWTPLDQLDVAITLSYLERRFGERVDLAWSAPIVDGARATVAEEGAEGELAVFLRFLDEDPPTPAALESELRSGETSVDTDAIVAVALWCDRLDLPGDFFDVLDDAGELGGYDVTHALGASQLLVENGCVDERRGRELVDDFAVPTAELLAEGPLGDLELEACAILAWTGRWDLIPEDLPARVAASQLDDGGWPLQAGDEASHPHATVWGLRCALELEHGATGEPVSWVPGGVVPATDTDTDT